MNTLANILTSLSLFAGFLSLIFSLEGHFTFAGWAIMASVVLDGLDGQIAKRNPLPSEFGKELDSLVDVVSFGIAPSLLGYLFVCRALYLWAILALFVYLFCSVMRLAKYNITPKEKQSYHFYGLPTTASGGVLASIILIYREHTRMPSPFIFLFVVLCLAGLMVSRIKYPNLDGLKKIFGKKVFLVLAVIAVIFVLVPHMTIFVLFLIYLLFSPFLLKKIV